MHENFPVKFGQCDPLRRTVKSLNIALGPEEPYLSSTVLVGLHAFEALDGVMEGGVKWMDGDGLQWGDSGVRPDALGAVNPEHMVSVIDAEAKGLGVKGGEGFQGGGFCDC